MSLGTSDSRDWREAHVIPEPGIKNGWKPKRERYGKEAAKRHERRPHETTWVTDYKWEFVLEEPACVECLIRYGQGYEEFRLSAVENCWHCQCCLDLFQAWHDRWYPWEMEMEKSCGVKR